MPDLSEICSDLVFMKMQCNLEMEALISLSPLALLSCIDLVTKHGTVRQPVACLRLLSLLVSYTHLSLLKN